MSRYSRIRVPMEHSRIKLTPEQEAEQQRLEQEQEEREREEHVQYMRQEAQDRADQVMFILDSIQQHPFLQELIGLKKQNNQRNKYLEIIIPAVIALHPTGEAEMIAKKSIQIADEICIRTMNQEELSRNR